VSVLLGIVPAWAHSAWRERRYLVCLVLTMLGAVLFVQSFSSAFARVTEFRADRGSSAQDVTAAHARAKKAVEDAGSAEATASANVDKFCSATSAVVTQSRSGRRVRTETKAPTANPLCETWTVQLSTRQENTRRARAALDDLPPVPAASADIQAMAAALHLDVAVVEAYQPAFLPLGIELGLMACFFIAFRPLPARAIEETEPVRRTPVPMQGTLDTVDVMPQDFINALVSKWLDTEGIPEGLTITQAHAKFNAFLKAQPIISLTRFGRALSANGVKKCTKQGRVYVHGRKAG
jgi:hypothetical protein